MYISIELLRKYSKQYGHSEALVIAELSVAPATKEELADRMDRTTRTIQSYLKPLVQSGLITKDQISHVWMLSSDLIDEINMIKKNISNTNIHTDNHIYNKQNNSNKETKDSTQDTTSEETYFDSKKYSSHEDHKANITTEDHYKAAKLACTIMFGQAMDTDIKELAKLLSHFTNLDMKLIASSAYVVNENVKSNPIMMFISTYRNKVRALQLLQAVRSKPNQDNKNKDVSEEKSKYSNRGAFVGTKQNDKYSVFYDLYYKPNEAV